MKWHYAYAPTARYIVILFVVRVLLVYLKLIMTQFQLDINLKSRWKDSALKSTENINIYSVHHLRAL